MNYNRSRTLRPTTLRSLFAHVSALGLILGLLGCGGESADEPFGSVLVDNNQALEESSGDAAEETVTFLLAETSEASASEIAPCPVGDDAEEDEIDTEESLSDDDESDDDESDDDESDDDESDDDESDDDESDDDESDDDESDDDESDDDESDDDDDVAPCEPAAAPEPSPIL